MPPGKNQNKKPDKIRQMQQQLQDFERLNKVLENVCSIMQVEETLKRIIEETLHLCNADQASILLIGPGDQREAKTLIREGKSRKEKLDHYLNNLLAGWTSLNKKPLLTDDLPGTLGKENIKQKYADIVSVLSVPLLLKGEVMGVINLITENEMQKFGNRELQLMTILATQCAQFICNARLHEELFKETIRLKTEVQDKYELHGIIGHSSKMQTVFSLLERVIPTDVRVLLEGETGTGKERIARAIHYNGLRKEAPFVAVDCGALPANLLESELFGYVKGAFTGADHDRKGLFEEAHGGTLFLDEIANMPQEVQSKLLRAIQESEIRPLGTSQVRKVDIRIIAAASGNLQAKVEAGKFRQDLFYRLNVVNIPLPPLRERKEDIAILANHFLDRMKEKYGKQLKGFKGETIRVLEAYTWPGNIRELEHAVERAVVLCEAKQLTKEDFPFLQTVPVVRDELFQPRPLQDAINDLKKHYICQILKNCGGVQKRAAEILHIQPTYLSRLIKELKIGK